LGFFQKLSKTVCTILPTIGSNAFHVTYKLFLSNQYPVSYPYSQGIADICIISVHGYISAHLWTVCACVLHRVLTDYLRIHSTLIKLNTPSARRAASRVSINLVQTRTDMVTNWAIPTLCICNQTATLVHSATWNLDSRIRHYFCSSSYVQGGPAKVTTTCIFDGDI